MLKALQSQKKPSLKNRSLSIQPPYQTGGSHVNKSFNALEMTSRTNFTHLSKQSLKKPQMKPKVNLNNPLSPDQQIAWKKSFSEDRVKGDIITVDKERDQNKSGASQKSVSLHGENSVTQMSAKTEASRVVVSNDCTKVDVEDNGRSVDSSSKLKELESNEHDLKATIPVHKSPDSKLQLPGGNK